MRYLWIDDERPVAKYFNCGHAEIAISYEEAIQIFTDMNNESYKICISFGHDLGNGKTGYDFAKWLVKHEVVGYFHIHTMNPVEAFNIRHLLEHYGWTEVFYEITKINS